MEADVKVSVIRAGWQFFLKRSDYISFGDAYRESGLRWRIKVDHKMVSERHQGPL